MHLRNLIAGILIVALLPASGFAAICDVNCRMATSLAQSPTSMPAHAAHHHHMAMQSPMSDEPTQAGSFQSSRTPHSNAGHSCCDKRDLSLSSRCSMPKKSAFFAQKVPNFGPDLSVSQPLAGQEPDIEGQLHHDTPINPLRRNSHTSSLPLRI
jgi:hypothetical protein